MKKQILSHIGRLGIFLAITTAALLLPHASFAATTGNVALFRQVGSGSNANVGDYISATVANGGINQIYQFYLEVPANTTQIVVRLFDAEIGGIDNGGGIHDWQQGAGYNTRCRYTLYTPAGVQQVTIRPAVAAAGYNNAWYTLATVASPAAGHWRLVADMSSANSAGGDDCNGWGFDVAGTNASGGVEIKAYAHSFVPVGELSQTGATLTTTLYPYITSGCSSNWKDFDGDSTTGACTITYRSRNGSISGSYTGSGSTVWLNTPISGYESDNLTVDSGIWTWTGTYTQTGANGGNFGVFYAGNFNNATTPPTAQPQGNTFRTYIPSGTGNTPGAAPAKPVFSQKISYVSGPNPPANGSATRVRIELIVFNPAVQAITFSAANPVTANVPGGGVVYAGSPVASQGTYTTPAFGGTGAVTWNPGTVSGGNTYATFYYYVDVTPTALTGPRYPVTGTPALNGTTARYVDETGNTTQAAATYTYGPLCELAVSRGGPNIPTWVAITCFEGTMASGQPTVEWHTSSEIGTLGFYLRRQDKESDGFQLVSPDFLPALPNAMTGGVYRLVDPYARYGETVAYQLEEVNARGESQYYGPFSVTFDSAPASRQESANLYQKGRQEVPTHVNGFQSAVLTASQYEKNRQQLRLESSRSQRARAMNQGSERARITVKSRGLVHVSAANLAAALTMSEAQVQGLIASRALSLSTQGEPVAWLADEGQGGIYFYAEKLESPYGDENVYWLERGLGLVMETASGGNAGPAAEGQTFNNTMHYEENRYPLTSLFSDPEADFWMWDQVVAGAGVKVFPIWVSSPATTGAATLTVNLQGGSDTAAYGEHHVQFYLNDNLIGESWWDGLDAHTRQLQFNQSLLRDGRNTFVVNGMLDGGVKYSYFYFNSCDLDYRQYYQVVNNTLWCRADGNQTISVVGFSDARVMVLDISQPRQPKLVGTNGLDAAGRLTFVPESPEGEYLVIGLSAVGQPLSVNGDSSRDLKRARFDAEYMLIAPEELAAEAEQLAEYRRSQGLTASVVTLADIYASFNHGLASPLAIRDFLKYARPKYSGKELKYAVLVGKGTFDYKNYLGASDNLMPVILAGTPEGLFAADNQYGDLEGYDGIPEVAVSRLPVVSAAELRTMIAKIRTYDASQGPWTDRAMMITDNDDGGGEFASTSEDLVKQLAGYAVDRISLLGHINAWDTRLAIIAGFNSGAALVNYVGHAGLNQLAEENILNIQDLPLLQNSGNLPVMVFATCAAGRFDIPGYVCLSEALLVQENGGIVAALAPLSASLNSEAGRLVEEFYKAVFRAQEKDLGTAWLSAAKNFISQGGKLYLLNVFSLQGDPAVKVK